jgi:hypothetical protein
VLTLGEPRAGGLAGRVRARLRHGFGSGAAVAARDLGDLRAGGILASGAAAPDPHRLQRWARALLERLLEAHAGGHPAAPVLPVLLVADGEDEANRRRLVQCVAPLRRALASLTLPESLQPRLAALVAWPAREAPAAHAATERWAAALTDECARHERLDAIFAVARSGCRAGFGADPRRMTEAERDDHLAEQAALLLATGVLEEVLAFRRGLARAAWCALAVDDGGAEAPWYAAPSDGAIAWHPAAGAWRAGAAAEAGCLPPVEGDVAAPLRVHCLYGMPRGWEAAPPPAPDPASSSPELVP